MKINPRVAQYARTWSDAEMDAVISKPAVQAALSGRDFTAQSEVLACALRAIFLPDARIRAILRHLVSLAFGHAQARFDTEEKYLAGLYSPLPWGTTTSPAICLTGLAGVGKSELLAALGKLLATKATFDSSGHTDIPLEGVWSMTLAMGSGLNQILKEFVLPGGRPRLPIDMSGAHRIATETKDLKIPLLLKTARRMSWRASMCMATIDEFQRIASSDVANAKATSILVQLLGLGPLLVYCPNFSLVHKLGRRKQEDRQRLLSRPIVLHPPTAGSENWTAYLSAVKSVAPAVFTFDLKSDADDIHHYTFGLKRLVVELVVLAFRMSKEKSAAGVVDGGALRAAFQSGDYSMNREEVEILHTQIIKGKMEREDLWCPFTSTEDSTNVKPLDAAVQEFESRTEDAFLAAAMLPSETAAVKVLAPEKPAGPSRGKVLRFHSKKATKDDLIAGANALDSID